MPAQVQDEDEDCDIQELEQEELIFVAKQLHSAQKSYSGKNKAVKAIVERFRSKGAKMLVEHLTPFIDALLIRGKNEAPLQRIIDLVVTIVCTEPVSLLGHNQKPKDPHSDEDDAHDDGDDDDDDDGQPREYTALENEKWTDGLVNGVLFYLLSKERSKDKSVRFRVCQMISSIMRALNEDYSLDVHTWDSLESVLLKRVQDKVPMVRRHAIAAMARLQTNSAQSSQSRNSSSDSSSSSAIAPNPVRDALLRAMEHDPNADCRKEALSIIELHKSTVRGVLRRGRDENDHVRAQAYKRFHIISIGALSIRNRCSIIKNGLTDRSHLVRNSCLQLLLHRWLPSKKNHLIKYLQMLDVETYEDDCEIILRELFKTDSFVNQTLILRRPPYGMSSVSSNSASSSSSSSSSSMIMMDVDPPTSVSSSSITESPSDARTSLEDTTNANNNGEIAQIDNEHALCWRVLCEHYRRQSELVKKHREWMIRRSKHGLRMDDPLLIDLKSEGIQDVNTCDPSGQLEMIMPDTVQFVELFERELDAKHYFVCKQLLGIAKYLDFTDEFSRNSLVQCLLSLLKSPNIDDDLIPTIMKLLRYLFNSKDSGGGVNSAAAAVAASSSSSTALSSNRDGMMMMGGRSGSGMSTSEDSTTTLDESSGTVASGEDEFTRLIVETISDIREPLESLGSEGSTEPPLSIKSEEDGSTNNNNTLTQMEMTQPGVKRERLMNKLDLLNKEKRKLEQKLEQLGFKLTTVPHSRAKNSRNSQMMEELSNERSQLRKELNNLDVKIIEMNRVIDERDAIEMKNWMRSVAIASDLFKYTRKDWKHPLIQPLFNATIPPALLHSSPSIRVAAIRAFTLFCCLDKSITERNIRLYITALTNPESPNENLTALQSLFDFVLIFDLFSDSVSKDDDGDDDDEQDQQDDGDKKGDKDTTSEMTGQKKKKKKSKQHRKRRMELLERSISEDLSTLEADDHNDDRNDDTNETSESVSSSSGIQSMTLKKLLLRMKSYLLSSEPRMQKCAVEGFCKLLYMNRLKYYRKEVLTTLVLLYFNPTSNHHNNPHFKPIDLDDYDDQMRNFSNNHSLKHYYRGFVCHSGADERGGSNNNNHNSSNDSNNEEIKQSLALFFPYFCDPKTFPKNRDLLRECLIPCIRIISYAPMINPLANISLSKFVEYNLHLINGEGLGAVMLVDPSTDKPIGMIKGKDSGSNQNNKNNSKVDGKPDDFSKQTINDAFQKRSVMEKLSFDVLYEMSHRYCNSETVLRALSKLLHMMDFDPLTTSVYNVKEFILLTNKILGRLRKNSVDDGRTDKDGDCRMDSDKDDEDEEEKDGDDDNDDSNENGDDDQTVSPNLNRKRLQRRPTIGGRMEPIKDKQTIRTLEKVLNSLKKLEVNAAKVQGYSDQNNNKNQAKDAHQAGGANGAGGSQISASSSLIIDGMDGLDLEPITDWKNEFNLERRRKMKEITQAYFELMDESEREQMLQELDLIEDDGYVTEPVISESEDDRDEQNDDNDDHPNPNSDSEEEDVEMTDMQENDDDDNESEEGRDSRRRKRQQDSSEANTSTIGELPGTLANSRGDSASLESGAASTYRTGRRLATKTAQKEGSIPPPSGRPKNRKYGGRSKKNQNSVSEGGTEIFEDDGLILASPEIPIDQKNMTTVVRNPRMSVSRATATLRRTGTGIADRYMSKTSSMMNPDGSDGILDAGKMTTVKRTIKRRRIRLSTSSNEGDSDDDDEGGEEEDEQDDGDEAGEESSEESQKKDAPPAPRRRSQKVASKRKSVSSNSEEDSEDGGVTRRRSARLQKSRQMGTDKRRKTNAGKPVNSAASKNASRRGGRKSSKAPAKKTKTTTAAAKSSRSKPKKSSKSEPKAKKSVANATRSSRRGRPSKTNDEEEEETITRSGTMKSKTLRRSGRLRNKQSSASSESTVTESSSDSESDKDESSSSPDARSVAKKSRANNRGASAVRTSRTRQRSVAKDESSSSEQPRRSARLRGKSNSSESSAARQNPRSSSKRKVSSQSKRKKADDTKSGARSKGRSVSSKRDDKKKQSEQSVLPQRRSKRLAKNYDDDAKDDASSKKTKPTPQRRSARLAQQKSQNDEDSSSEDSGDLSHLKTDADKRRWDRSVDRLLESDGESSE